MTWRFSISTDGGTVWTVVSPLNGSKLKVEQSRDLDAGQVFFRKKLTGKPMLGGDDFKLIDAVRRNPTRRCEELLIKCERDCGQWQEYWRGGFTALTCDWNFDDCALSINPKTIDRYTCLLDAQERKVNLLKAPPVDAEVIVLPPMQFGVCWSVGTGYPVNCSEFYDGVGFINEWTPGHAQVTDANGDTYQLNIFWRERIRTECINGMPSPPPGTGWVLEADSCASKGTATFIRPASIAWSFGDAVRGSIVDGVPVPPAGDCLWMLLGVIDEAPIDPFDLTLGLVPWYVCITSGDAVDINRSRTLQSALNLIIEDSACEGLTLSSDFFEWDAVGDAPGYAPGLNYATAEPNQVSGLLIIQKSDALDPGASNPATIGEMSWKEAMEMLRVMFRCYWDIDDQGRVRIEHWSYWLGVPGIDLLDQDAIIEAVSMSGDASQIPKGERPSFMEAQGRDFVGVAITYASPCATADTEQPSPGKVTTDITYAIIDPDALSKDGFMILAATPITGGYSVILDDGVLTGVLVTNAPLSWANLEDAFWRHDRYLPSGVMNEAPTDFESFLPTVQQEGVSFRACCSLLAFDPRRRINGALARRLGVLGVVETVSHDLYTDRITMVLRYPY